MKTYLLGFFLIALQLSARSQVIQPVNWQTSVQKTAEKKYNLVATATIPKDFHLYSQNIPKGGPVATSFNYNQTVTGLQLIGKTSESRGYTLADSVFKMTITFFKNKAVFKQHVTVPEKLTTIKASVRYMICNNRQCSPPTNKALIFDLSKAR